MAEPVKVNAYRLVIGFVVSNETWHILEDDNTVIITRAEDTICIDEERKLYSVIVPRWEGVIKVPGRHVHAVMFNASGNVTIVKKGVEDDSNKKNDAKI